VPTASARFGERGASHGTCEPQGELRASLVTMPYVQVCTGAEQRPILKARCPSREELEHAGRRGGPPHALRPLPVTIATILLALVSLTDLPFPWWYLFPGAEDAPDFVVYAGDGLGIVGLGITVGCG